MAKIYTSAEALIGNTPLLQLCRLEQEEGLQATVLAKLEMCNPAGSVKDRAALYMLDDAEKRGVLNKNTVIIEPTSGNTGIGLCAVAAARGYHCIIVMPASMSVERRMIMAAYGAEVVLSPAEEGMTGAIRMAKELAEKYPDSMIAGQFENPANPMAHYCTTGPEIWADTEGKVDLFVAGVGTGGTVTGTGKFLKEQNPAVQVVGVEPADSPVLTAGKSGKHGIQGIGAGFVPEALDVSILDEVMTVTTEEAYGWARRMGAQEGVLVGISSGAALCAAVKLAKRAENAGKTIVALLPDSGERYLSTDLYR